MITAVLVGIAVPVVLLLGPYAWMLLPWNWEFQAKPGELEREAREYAENYWAGFFQGLNTDLRELVTKAKQ